MSTEDKQTDTDKQPFVSWVKGMLSTLGQSQMTMKAALQHQARALEVKNKQVSMLLEKVEALQKEVTSLKFAASISDEQVKQLAYDIDRLQGIDPDAQVLQDVEEVNEGVDIELNGITHEALVEYVEELVEDLSDVEDKDKGANILGFNRELVYDKGTVGHALRYLMRSVEYQPRFLNLGPVQELMAHEEITVTQTNTKVFNPKDVLDGEIKTINGGELNDIVVFTARGSVTFKRDVGNLILKRDFKLRDGGVLALRKIKNGWTPIWFS